VCLVELTSELGRIGGDGHGIGGQYGSYGNATRLEVGWKPIDSVANNGSHRDSAPFRLAGYLLVALLIEQDL
jgi:hypothetical protein